MLIKDGREVEIIFNPDSGWYLDRAESSIGQNPWTMSGDKDVTVVFDEQYPGYPGHPYNIPDAWWIMYYEEE